MLKDYSHKMIFKSFDVERTPASQGFEEHTYDMIIASNVLHATKSLQTTLENTRRLLKPGGYLLMLEITNNGPIRFASMTSGLPGWWVGIDDGRVYTPTVSAPVWDRVLKSSGFSGTDTTIADRDGLVWPFSVISTQAVDWRVNFIREPLSFSPRIMEIEQLVILGTELPETSVIAKRVAGILRKYCKKITILRGLPLEDDLISSQSTFLNLVDLDEPVFKNLTTEKMNGIKRLLNLSKNILWVTKGCQDDQPYHMASVGFGRTICHEMPHLRLQFLDLDDLQETASHTIVETLLRLISTGEWESKGEFGSDVLWTTEPELMVQRGQLLLPRLLPNNDQNARLNSRRRFITKDVNLRTSIVSLSRNSKSVALLDESLEDKFDVNHDLVAVSCSILPAVRVSSKSFLFLGIGTMEQTGQTVAYLSETNSSKAVPAYCSGPAMVPRDKSQQFLSAILGHLMVASFIEDLPNDSTILIHEPDPAIVPILLCEAKTKNIHVLLSTVSTGRKDTVPWIYLQPLLSKRKIKSMLPSAISHFVDLSVDGEAKEVGSQVSKVLGSECVSLGLSNIFRGQSLMQKRDTSDFSARLQNAVAKAEKSFSEHVARSITVGKIGELSISEALTPIVIDWSIDNVVSVQIQPSSSDGLFSKNKTYLLVGLTGQLGQSLCEWMARNGAGYVCLASRSPEVEEEWIKSVETHGTTVRIFKL
jgi:hybrid polyketide synthase/nonribosomal peptide synthetase ACE1